MITQPAIQYDVFLSYRRSEARAVTTLVDALSRRGLSSFVDTASIGALDDFPNRIRDAIASSYLFVAYWSADYADSEHCLNEFKLAWQLARRQSSALEQRIWVVNPEPTAAHIFAGELTSKNHFDLPRGASFDTLTERAHDQIQVLRPLGPLAFERQLTSAAPLFGTAAAPSRLVGREAQLLRLHTALHPARIDAAAAAPRVKVCGLPGIGKSALVATYAREFAAAYSGGIFFLSLAALRDIGPIEEGAARAAWLVSVDRMFDGTRFSAAIRDSDGRLKDPQSARRALAAEKVAAETLWIVDDFPLINPVDVRDSVLDFVASPFAGGKTVVTTQDRSAAGRFDDLVLTELSTEQGQRLLGASRRPVDDSDGRSARNVVNMLGGHPQALRIVGEFMKFRAATYDVLLTELTRAGAVQRVEQIATALAPQLGSYARGIVATFELAIGALTEGGRRILALASLCEPNSPVPTFVLEEGTLLGPDAATVAYFEVVRASLLEHSAATEKMPMGARIHPITSYVAVLLLNPDVPTLQRWLALPMLERFVEAGDGSAQRACAPFVQQAVHVAGLCESDAAWALRSRAASYFLEIGDFENAHIQAERAYRVYAQLHGDDTGTLTRLNDLALVKLGRGDHEAARVLLQQVREKRESLHGAMHPKTMESAGYEALALSLRGDRLAAESLFRSVVDHQVAAHGAEALQTATTTYHMAASLADWGRYAEARSLLEPLVATLRQGTEDTRLLALALSAFGTSVEKVDGPARALDLHGEAVAVAQQSAGGELVALTCKANRAVCLSAMGRERDTLAIHTEVLARRRELLPRDHPDVISSLFNAGSTHMGLAEPHAALPLLEEGLDLCRRVNGGGHLKTVLFLHALGVAQNAVGEHDRAQSTLEEGLKALENLDGDARMVRIGLLREVGLTRRMRGDLQGARTALVEALDLARALHGDASAESIDLAEGLLVALHAIGDVEAECEVLEFQVRSRRERFGATSAELLDTLEKLVAAYRFGKQPRRALDAARRLLDVCGRAAFGRNHQRTLKGRHFMAMLLRESGDTSTCRAIWRDILPKLVAQRGPEDDLVTDAYLGLIETFELPRDERAVQAITKQFPLTVVAAAKRFSKM